jgi:hypothetical protein
MFQVVADLQDLLNNDARVLSAVKREARCVLIGHT